MTTPLLFSTFEVTRQVFYQSSLSYAIVNLKPIVPGHVLVVPARLVPRLSDLNASELSCLMQSVNRVGKVIERVYGADGLTIACQDGKAAGQTVPHVHFHLLPRKLSGDYFSERKDDIYPALEENEAQLPPALKEALQTKPLTVDADENRRPRSLEDMEKEANWLKGFFQEMKEAHDGTS